MWATFGKMTKTVAARTLREHRAVLKDRRTNNLTEKRGGVTKDKVQFGLTGIVESKEDASIIWDTALRRIARGKPARGG